ncbi:pirin family protein [Roseospirillum parvum]|uniref:Pirin N-terminal domain-containing protein n=1 Tax=Roseospirillum parvum TaxID=83401 RepID=A0A1G7UWL6_9PROT|nr:pirin-like bicupin family protein [Roseospirillum parvum]SDG51995.1 hypothetical protein SAMN05421742_101459 [Roseospirillum parvum]
MIERRPFDTFGAFDHGWLDTHHHFSFGDYHDPERVNWGALRVWNDDTIAPGTGFPAHPHRDMEIITYVRKGAISHQDNLGNEGRTAAGDVQVMSAGSGIVHAEFNQEDEPTELFQIWIHTAQRGAKPSWGTRPFPRDARAGRFVTLASGLDDDADALPIGTPARVLGATLAAGQEATLEVGRERHLYLVSVDAPIEVNGVRAEPRDGVAATDETTLTVRALADTEIVLVDAQ